MAACAAETGDRPSEEIAGALYGDFSTVSCTASQSGTLIEGHRVGKLIAMMNEFDACLRGRIMNLYLPCYEDGASDPFSSSSRATQYTNARNIMRSGNTAPTSVECDDIDSSGHAGIGHYANDDEVVTLGDDFINGKLENGGLDVWERADVGAAIWHEALHQQGYRHSDDGDPDDEHCGYDLDEYARGFNSIPYMADRCMRAAGIHSRVMAWKLDGTAQQFGPGRYRGNLGELGAVGDDAISKMRLPPASIVRYCKDEGLTGAGVNCRTERNETIEYGGSHIVPTGYTNAISFVELEPTALVFNARDYSGTVQALRYGEHLANAGALNGVGNDSIRSIYIPAGVRVRACEHENGPGGHGAGICATYESPQPLVGTLEARISYVEVVRVVSAFPDWDLYAPGDSYDVGLYHGTDGGLGVPGDNNIASIVVPHGLSARVCSSISATGSGAGWCTTLTRTNFALPAAIANELSYMNVTPNTIGTQRLTVSRAGHTGAGSVVSMPVGINCPGDCSGDYLTRSEVRLRAFPPTNGNPEWTGCDRRVGNDCYVSMTGARNLRVYFATLDQECYQECVANCDVVNSACIRECRATCTF